MKIEPEINKKFKKNNHLGKERKNLLYMFIMKVRKNFNLIKFILKNIKKKILITKKKKKINKTFNKEKIKSIVRIKNQLNKAIIVLINQMNKIKALKILMNKSKNLKKLLRI